MGICQIALIIGLFLTPYGIESFISAYGFRKTLMGLTLLSVLIFVNTTFLKPVEKYIKKVYTVEEFDNKSKLPKYYSTHGISSIIIELQIKFHFHFNQWCHSLSHILEETMCMFLEH